MPHHRAAIGIPILLVLVAAGLGACGGDSVFGATTTTAAATTVPPSTTEAPTTSASASTSSSTTAAAPTGCVGGPAVVPAGAVSTEVPDVDGDGLKDTAWLIVEDGTVRVGLVTAAGGAERLWDSASPAPRSVLVADADGQPPVEIFASDNREVQLWQFRDCAIQDVVDSGGQPFLFSLGFGPIGTGVGCVVIGGAMRLVRLDVVSSDATSVTWSRTIINVVDGVATDGATQTGTFTRPGDDAAIALLHEVSCGALTMREDGITAHES